MVQEIDGFDRKILKRLQETADVSAERLAEEVGLSASAVLRRIRALKRDGVITHTAAILSPNKLACAFRVIALVEMNRESPQDRVMLKTWCERTPEVQQAYYVTGSFDLVLVLLTPDIEHYDALMTELQESISCIRKVTTNVNIETMKAGLQVPIPE